MEYKNKFAGLFRYQQKVFGLPSMIQEFDQIRKGKQTNDANVMFGVIGGLASGINSLSGLARAAGISRSVLENFLNLDGLSSRLRRFIKAMIKRMKRGKMISLQHVRGRCLAAIDGVETMRRSYTPTQFYDLVRLGFVDLFCQVAVHRDSKTKEITSFDVYHRIVIICMITERGPIPCAWRYQQSDAGEKYATWLTNGSPAVSHPADGLAEDKAKQEGELTVLGQLLPEISQGFCGKMPFDILMGDGLYDKATVLLQAERYGVALIAVQKDERRNIRKDANEDFSTRPPDTIWEEVKRSFEAWSGVYIDPHINRRDQRVKIVRVKRQNKDRSVVDNYFYCSNQPWISPRVVEWCRHYRWKEENGFNAWTNLWGVLKHIFHHPAAACDAMIGFFFIAVIAVQNYRCGNLRRGGRRKIQTLKEFFNEVAAGYAALRLNRRNYLLDYLNPKLDAG